MAIGAGSCAIGVIGERNFQLLAQHGFEFFANVLMFLEELAGVFAALAHALAAEADPRAALFQDAAVDAEIDEVAFARNAFAVNNVELGFAEGRGDFIFHNFGASARADDPVAFLDGLNAANIDAHGGVKLQGAAAGGGFGIAEHDANLFANLVDENEAGARLGNDGGELAQGLRHETGLQAHLRVAHFAFQFGFGDQRGNGVDDDDIDAAGANQGFGDFESLLAVVGLRDEEVVDVDAQLAGVDGIEGVLGVDEGGLAASFWASAMT
jgi:hypothetical protein